MKPLGCFPLVLPAPSLLGAHYSHPQTHLLYFHIIIYSVKTRVLYLGARAEKMQLLFMQKCELACSHTVIIKILSNFYFVKGLGPFCCCVLGKYYLLCIVIVALSLIITTLVLTLHHHATVKPVPEKVITNNIMLVIIYFMLQPFCWTLGL